MLISMHDFLVADGITLANLAIFYVSTKSIKPLINYKIKKEFNTIDVNKIILPEGLKKSIETTAEFDDEDLKKALIEFSKLLVDNFPNEWLEYFYTNIKGTEVKNIDLLTSLYSGISGCFYYNKYRKTIKVFSYSNIFHELFHLASSYLDIDNNILYCGFEISYIGKEEYDFGTGINEGYTELMAERYFGQKYKNSRGAYYKEVHIAEHLEKILGKKCMEELFLTANQNGLIDEMSKYLERDLIIKFIEEVDKNKKNIHFINKKLLEMYKNKMLMLLNDNDISLDDAVDSYISFYDSLLRKKIPKSMFESISEEFSKKRSHKTK